MHQPATHTLLQHTPHHTESFDIKDVVAGFGKCTSPSPKLRTARHAVERKTGLCLIHFCKRERGAARLEFHYVQCGILDLSGCLLHKTTPALQLTRGDDDDIVTFLMQFHRHFS